MQRRPTKNTRGPNAAEKRYHSWIKEEARKCASCGHTAPLIAHHCEGATFKNNKVLIGHWFVVGLCQSCDDIVTHGSRRALRNLYGPQSEMWEMSYNTYKLDSGNDECPNDVYDAIMDWGR